MENVGIANALIIVNRILSQHTNDWMLIGTSSLYLQGFNVKPKDIDILCTAEVAALIEDLLSKYKIQNNENISRDKFRSVLSQYQVNDILVELMGDLEVSKAGVWINLLDYIDEQEEVLFNDVIFKVPSKTDQVKIYRLFGRDKDIQTLQLLDENEIF